MLTRRRFFQALAASAVAAGVPLPIGFSTAKEFTTVRYWGYDEPEFMVRFLTDEIADKDAVSYQLVVMP